MGGNPNRHQGYIYKYHIGALADSGWAIEFAVSRIQNIDAAHSIGEQHQIATECYDIKCSR
jgi:hypothetical protein